MSLDTLFTVPPAQRSANVLDRAAFTKRVPLHALQIPAARTTVYKDRLFHDVLKQRKVSSVTADPSSAQHRLLLLNYLQQCVLSSCFLNAFELRQ
jgi:hypothetical protein